MSTKTRSRKVIEVTDLSLIKEVTSEEDLWLHSLASVLQGLDLTISLGGANGKQSESVIEYRNREWWTGRFIGEIHYEGRTLRIKPRYEAAFYRWITTIWNLQMIQQKGSPASSTLWLWNLIARIWDRQLMESSKHGLPYVRREQSHIGQTVRGSLDVRKTADLLRKGHFAVASKSRERVLDERIGVMILSAYAKIRSELLHTKHTWLSERSTSLLRKIQTQLPKSVIEQSLRDKTPIQYRPITELYRPLVEMSRRILEQKPFSTEAKGQQSVTGVLIDMAEVWELYVYHVLKSCEDLIVTHEGRSAEAASSLFINEEEEELGRLKPDILVYDRTTFQCVGVIDAKYKKTTMGLDRPKGVTREDLYQINAYQSAFSKSGEEFQVALVYPFDEGGNIPSLEAKSPWRLKHQPEKQLWFFGLFTDDLDEKQDALSESEQKFVKAVQEWCVT